MKHRYRPLYLIGIAVLAAGLVVGVAFAGVSGDAVLVGTVVLAGLMTMLFLLGKRDGSHDVDDVDEHDERRGTGPR